MVITLEFWGRVFAVICLLCIVGQILILRNRYELHTVALAATSLAVFTSSGAGLILSLMLDEPVLPWVWGIICGWSALVTLWAAMKMMIP